MPTLGPKESSYLDIIRDAWQPLMARREIRQALFAFIVGLGVVTVGISTLFWVRIPDLGPTVAGFFFIGWGASTLWAFRVPFSAWRTIGALHLEFPDGALIAGEASALDIVITPRRPCVVQSATLLLYAKDSRGIAAIGDPWRTGLVFDGDLPVPGDVPVGTESRISVTIAIDPSAPSSWFGYDFVRQWFGIVRVTCDDGRLWEREYPLLVYPSVLPFPQALHQLSD